MPTNYSACVRIPELNFSRDKIFVVNVQPAKTAKIFNLENFRLYGIFSISQIEHQRDHTTVVSL